MSVQPDPPSLGLRAGKGGERPFEIQKSKDLQSDSV